MRFNVAVGLRHRFVISPWLFNLPMDKVIREWTARIINTGAYLNERDGR